MAGLFAVQSNKWQHFPLGKVQLGLLAAHHERQGSLDWGPSAVLQTHFMYGIHRSLGIGGIKGISACCAMSAKVFVSDLESHIPSASRNLWQMNLLLAQHHPPSFHSAWRLYSSLVFRYSQDPLSTGPWLPVFHKLCLEYTSYYLPLLFKILTGVRTKYMCTTVWVWESFPDTFLFIYLTHISFDSLVRILLRLNQ